MDEEKKKQINEAIAVIREYCRNNRIDCVSCPLAEYICDINSVPPHEWQDIE